MVTFLNGTSTIGTAMLVNGKATLSTTTLPTGSDSITVSYGGDSNFTGITSAVLTQVVNQGATTAKVTSSTNPSAFGQNVTFTATVSAKSPASGTPSGMVTFLDGTATLATLPLSGGTVAYSTSALAVGSHSITVQYTGDGNFTGSTSPVLNQTVGAAATVTAVTSTASPSAFGAIVTFAATVTASSSGAGVLSGTVLFKDGSTVLGIKSPGLSGQASLAISALSIGTHTITATYVASTNFQTSVSAPLTQVVAPASIANVLAIQQGQGVSQSIPTPGPTPDVAILDRIFATLGSQDDSL
jgi:hypothetical protein